MYEITNFHYFITIIIILFDASPVVKELLRLCSKAFRVELMIRHQELAFAMSKGIEHDERVPRRLGMFFHIISMRQYRQFLTVEFAK